MLTKILYIQYTNPAAYPSLEHSSRILAGKGWKVLFLGTGSHGADTFRFLPHPNIQSKRWPFCPRGSFQKLHFAGFCVWTILTAVVWRPDWVYTSDLFSCPAGSILSFFGFKVIYHEHDSPINSGGKRQSIFIRVLLGFRHFLAKWAKMCVIPNEQRGALFRLEMNGCTCVQYVWNCPSLEEVPQAVSKSSEHFIFLYHGSIVPNRLPLTVLEAFKQLPNQARLRIIGYGTVGYPDYLTQLKSKAEELGLGSRFHIIGEVPTRKELFRLGSECHVGLAFMPLRSRDINEQNMTGASNKPFDYIACGLALLASDLPDWKAMFINPGYGLACDPESSESIAGALRWFFEHPKEMREMGEKGRQKIMSEWNYEKQFKPVLSQMGY